MLAPDTACTHEYEEDDVDIGEVQTVFLHHCKLKGRWGCMYHSLYAVSGDESLLDEEVLSDVSDMRWRVRALQLGFLIQPWYVHPSETCEPEDWRGLTDQLPPHAHVALLVSMPSHKLNGERHQVAVLLRGSGEVSVSDSSMDGLIDYDSEEAFLASRYAVAFSIEVLALTRLDAHPKVDAREWLELLE